MKAWWLHNGRFTYPLDVIALAALAYQVGSQAAWYFIAWAAFCAVVVWFFDHRTRGHRREIQRLQGEIEKMDQEINDRKLERLVRLRNTTK